jgi:hypothetical protein
MTDSDDTSTRPISVAELLAKNGTIGAPPVGGRRRRRRGNSDAVTVAELTGEIPIVNTGSMRTVAAEPVPAPPVEDEVAEPVEPEARSEPEVEPASGPDAEAQPEGESEPEGEPEPEAEVEAEAEVEPAPEPALTEAEADYQAHLQQRDSEPDPIDFTPPPPRRPRAATTGSFPAQLGGAEQMSPDPVIDEDELPDLGPDDVFDDVLDEPMVDQGATIKQEVPTYLRSGSDTLFGGQSVADEAARRGPRPGPEDIDLGEDLAAEPAAVETPAASGQQGSSAFVRGVWVVVQCILAVAFGAGLFIAFDQLWRWNTIVALVLSVLVILGLVVGVRVVRKTEDIGSTLIAVAVGALVTLGPLALLQSH